MVAHTALSLALAAPAPPRPRPWLGSARLGSARLGSARPGLGSARPGSAHFSPTERQFTALCHSRRRSKDLVDDEGFDKRAESITSKSNVVQISPTSPPRDAGAPHGRAAAHDVEA